MKKQLLVLLMLGAFVGQVQAGDFEFDGNVYKLNELQMKLFDRKTKDKAKKDEWIDALRRWFPDKKEFNELGDYKKSEVVETEWAPPVKLEPGRLKQIEDQKKLEEAQRLARVKAEKEAEVLRKQQEKEAAEAKLEEERLAAEEKRLAEELKKEEAEREAQEKARKEAEEAEQKRLDEEAEEARKEEERLAEELRKEQARLAQARVEEEMRLFEAEKLRVKTAQEKEQADKAANLRMLEVADKWFEDFNMTCANCPDKTCAGCTTAERGQECDAFNADRFMRAALRKKGTQSRSPLDNLFPLYFDDTYILYLAQIAPEATSARNSLRQATDGEFSPFFRLLYDCARGFYEDPDLRNWEQVRQKKLENYEKAGIEAPELKSWAEKLPLLISELKKRGFSLESFDVTVPYNSYYNFSYGPQDYRYGLGINYDSLASFYSQIAEHFKRSTSSYERDIFNNSNSKIYSYMGTLTDANLNRTQAGRDALALVAAEEQQEQAQAALAQLPVRAAAAAAAAPISDYDFLSTVHSQSIIDRGSLSSSDKSKFDRKREALIAFLRQTPEILRKSVEEIQKILLEGYDRLSRNGLGATEIPLGTGSMPRLIQGHLHALAAEAGLVVPSQPSMPAAARAAGQDDDDTGLDLGGYEPGLEDIEGLDLGGYEPGLDDIAGLDLGDGTEEA